MNRNRGGGPVRWLVGVARPQWGRFGVGVLAGAAALGSAVGLMAVSAWLVSRAAQHPPVLYLTVAIVGVRAFGLGRGVFRYAERLVSHDAAFRVLAALRVRVYEGLERLAPAGLPAFRRGDLLGRLVADVDDTQDLFLRALTPPAIAVVVGVASVGVSAALLPAAGVILFAGLLVAGLAAPWVSTVLGRRADRRLADVRGELTAATVELLQGAPELIAYGAAPARLAELERLDRRLTRLGRSVRRRHRGRRGAHRAGVRRDGTGSTAGGRAGGPGRAAGRGEPGRGRAAAARRVRGGGRPADRRQGVGTVAASGRAAGRGAGGAGPGGRPDFAGPAACRSVLRRSRKA